MGIFVVVLIIICIVVITIALTIFLINFLISYSEHKVNINPTEDYSFTVCNDIQEDINEPLKYKKYLSKNVYMNYNTFKPLYKGNQSSWLTLTHQSPYSYSDNVGYIPFYIDNDDEDEPDTLYFVHFSTIFGYLAYYIKYSNKVLKGRNASNNINIMKITEDVQHECEKKT